MKTTVAKVQLKSNETERETLKLAGFFIEMLVSNSEANISFNFSMADLKLPRIKPRRLRDSA